MTPESILKLNGLSVEIEGSDGGVVLPVSGVSLEIPKGKTVALVGESGCGKSLTALSIMRLLPEAARVSSGTDLLLGRDLFPIPEREMRSVRGKRIGMIFQEPSTSMNPVMTVGNQIGEVLQAHCGLRGKERRTAEVEWLRRVGIPEPERRVDSFPFQLSGGQKQRCMIAMALAGRPDLVIADEPTTALDVTVQKQILELLLSLQASTGLSMLLITHDLAVVRKMAHEVALMYAGEIVEKAPADEFFRHPVHPYAKQLLAAMPSSRSRGKRLASIPGTVPAPGELITGCRFAPRCLQSAPECRAALCLLKEVSPGHFCSCARPEFRVPLPDDTREMPREKPLGDVTLDAREISVEFPSPHRFLTRRKCRSVAVDKVSLSIRAGETLALVGESGSGKTTFGRAVLRLLAGATLVTGKHEIHGPDSLRARRREMLGIRRSAQMIFQDPFSSLDPRMTVGETILEALESLRPDLGEDAKRERIRKVAERVGIRADALRRYPHEFSGGQRQRIAIARALAPEPRLVICDEPTSALDVSVQAQIINLLEEIQEESGIAFLLITHNFGVVEHIAGRVAVMRRGRIVEAGTADEVLGNPRAPSPPTLLASAPRL